MGRADTKPLRLTAARAAERIGGQAAIVLTLDGADTLVAIPSDELALELTIELTKALR